MGEKKRLADEAETTASRLVRAEKLTSGLASEGVRWLESLENLGKQKVGRVDKQGVTRHHVIFYRGHANREGWGVQENHGL